MILELQMKIHNYLLRLQRSLETKTVQIYSLFLLKDSNIIFNITDNYHKHIGFKTVKP